jgi:hypothetical protein
MPDNKNVEIKHLKNTGILPEKTRTGIIDVSYS